jgi:hypothetical protein
LDFAFVGVQQKGESIQEEKSYKEAMKSSVHSQNVSFKSLDDFFEFVPQEELTIVNLLRDLVFSCIPGATEKLSYNVPFYRRFKNICFIWPSSIMWGNRKTYEGVRFGFTNGYLLKDELNYLERGTRKQVYWKDFKTVNEIDIHLLKAYLFEAVSIDVQMAQKKKQAQS